ncbi:hypothetical protein F4677DRAFT_394497 [Hypoxylon crocopeplum]|nr:hypothetical protein F4677DRAFT_394497 [Hypoxylon crocopeplum]
MRFMYLTPALLLELVLDFPTSSFTIFSSLPHLNTKSLQPPHLCWCPPRTPPSWRTPAKRHHHLSSPSSHQLLLIHSFTAAAQGSAVIPCDSPITASL